MDRTVEDDTDDEVAGQLVGDIGRPIRAYIRQQVELELERRLFGLPIRHRDPGDENDHATEELDRSSSNAGPVQRLAIEEWRQFSRDHTAHGAVYERHAQNNSWTGVCGPCQLEVSISDFETVSEFRDAAGRHKGSPYERQAGNGEGPVGY